MARATAAPGGRTRAGLACGGGGARDGRGRRATGGGARDGRGRSVRGGGRIAGVGVGLRWELLDEMLEVPPAVSFVEVSPENYMGRGGYYDEALERVKEVWPIVTHGLTMSVGGTDPLRGDYLAGLRAFIARVGSPWHSDHLCFSSAEGVILHDLLPLAFKAGEVERIADRIKQAQDAIGVPFAIENVSSYLHPGTRDMDEAEFIARVCERAGCGLMLDVNNAYVNATNFGFDVDAWMRTVPLDRVVQIHVAGHEWFDEEDGRIIIDTHGADVDDAVLALLERTLERTGPVPVLLERDQAIPPLATLLEEVRTLEAIYERATKKAAAR
ncbi:MAG: DUF692 domain-containing protein [Labilithrix sp.]|nr:DUF692 domain-containing protein [Labilithrix sp.]MCW5817477.1 DUF692 domain-containing protein [Labilithrix sp.]